VVDAGGVAVDGGGGLGAEVAVAGVEVEGADVVGAVGAGELHASLDAGDGVETLHNFSVSSSPRIDMHGGWAAKVMRGGIREFLGGKLLPWWKLLARPRVAPEREGSFDCGCPSRLRREGQSSLRMTNREGDESLKKSLGEAVVFF